MITTVLFDLDGLLIDSELTYFQMAKEFVEMHGKTFTLEQYVKDHTGRILLDNMQSYIDMCGISMTAEEGVEWTVKREAEITANGIPLKPGAEELIKYLKAHGIKMYLATSSTHERTVKILTLDGVLDYFDGSVCGTEVEHGKPDPEVFLTCAQKAGEIPAHCLVLEDSENGIRAAHAGGFPVICVPDLKVPDKDVLDMTTAVVKSLDEVIPLISKL